MDAGTRSALIAGLLATGWVPLDGFAAEEAQFWLAPTPLLWTPLPFELAVRLQRAKARGRTRTVEPPRRAPRDLRP